MAVFVVQLISTFLGPLLLAALALLCWLALARRSRGTPRPMGRFAFGVLYVGLCGLLAGTGLVWLRLAEVSIDLATLGTLGAVLGLALPLAWAARRRSVAIWGTTEGAVLAALPPLALILMLKPSRPRRAARRLTRRALQVELYAIALIAATVPAVILAQMTVDARRAATLKTETLPPGRAVAIHAAFASAIAPMRIDAATVLDGATGEGTNLTLSFRIFGMMVDGIDPGTLNATLSDTVPKAICANRTYSHIIDSGGTVTYAFAIDLADTPTMTARITVNTCGGTV